MTGDFGETMHKKLIGDIKKYIDRHMFSFSDMAMISESKMAPQAMKKSVAEDLADYINRKQTMGFQKRLFKYIDQRGYTDPEVYKRAGLDKRLFSKIRSNPLYHPSKETVIALSMALELELDQAEDLLEEAGYALNTSEQFDLIIRYFFENEMYNLITLNEVLDDFGEKLIGRF